MGFGIVFLFYGKRGVTGYESVSIERRLLYTDFDVGRPTAQYFGTAALVRRFARNKIENKTRNIKIYLGGNNARKTEVTLRPLFSMAQLRDLSLLLASSLGQVDSFLDDTFNFLLCALS